VPSQLAQNRYQESVPRIGLLRSSLMKGRLAKPRARRTISAGHVQRLGQRGRAASAVAWHNGWRRKRKRTQPGRSPLAATGRWCRRWWCRRWWCRGRRLLTCGGADGGSRRPCEAPRASSRARSERDRDQIELESEIRARSERDRDRGPPPSSAGRPRRQSERSIGTAMPRPVDPRRRRRARRRRGPRRSPARRAAEACRGPCGGGRNTHRL